MYGSVSHLVEVVMDIVTVSSVHANRIPDVVLCTVSLSSTSLRTVTMFASSPLCVCVCVLFRIQTAHSSELRCSSGATYVLVSRTIRRARVTFWREIGPVFTVALVWAFGGSCPQRAVREVLASDRRTM